MSAAARMGALYQEHVYLAAELEPAEEGGVMRVAAYPSEDGKAFDAGAAYLCDLTGSTYELISGESSCELVEAVFCSRKLGIGECAWQASLTAEGALTSVPLVGRGGQGEYVLLDPTPRGQVVSAWAGFIAMIEQDGYAPYAGSALEDATDMLTPLMLAGNAAREVLSDYVERPSALPSAGHMANVYLDRISALVASPRLPGAPGLPVYVLLVPVSHAVTLWRSFLSFSEVEPMGHRALTAALKGMVPWGEALFDPDQVKPSREELAGWGLLRGESDFIGARAL